MDENYSREGRDALNEGDFETGGDYYTQAAYQALALNSITKRSEHQIGGGLKYLHRAAVSYRRGGHTKRCQNRCKQGILITEDLLENVVSDERKRAVLQEFIADFHGIGGLDGADEVYQETVRQYEDVDLAYTISYHSPPISDAIIEASQYLFKISDMRPGDEVEVPFDFKGRVLFKKNNIDSIVESITG